MKQQTHPAELVLPSDIEAERALLGCLLTRPNELLRVGPIDASMFSNPDNGAILKAIQAAWEADPRVDMAGIVRQLRADGVYDDLGGFDTLEALMKGLGGTPPMAAGAHAKRIIEVNRLRQIIATAQEIVVDGSRCNGDVAEFITKAESAMFDAARIEDTPKAVTIFEAAHEVYSRLEAGQSARGVLTGFDDIDQKLRGLKPGNLVIVAARPSMGKSALALNIAEHAARVQGVPTLFISLEMTRDELSTRLLASRTGYTASRINEGQLGAGDYEVLVDAIGGLQGVPLHLLDLPGMTMNALRSHVRRLVSRAKIGLVVVDYLQLIRGDGDSRYDTYSRISNDLKALARQLEVPVIAAAQLNRESERRPGKRPQLGDLRESGAIEQDADIVLLIHRDDYHRKDEEGYTPDNRAEVIIAKHRNGPTGVVGLGFDGRFTRFTNFGGGR